MTQNEKPKTRIKRDLLTRTPKWVLLSAFWFIQGAFLYFAQAFLYESQGDIYIPDPKEGEEARGFFVKELLGEWPTWDSYTDLLVNHEFVFVMSIAIIMLTAAQILFLLPVRRPGRSGTRGHSLKLSLYVSGAVIGGLVLATTMMSLEYAHIFHDASSRIFNHVPGDQYTIMGLVLLLGWAVASPMLFAFTRPGRRETVLARLAKKIFIGTIIEVALLIPIDVMIRRKTACYCDSGSYWALTLCGFIGVFALGPAVFLPVLAKRRKTWYSGHCGVCGYDMNGTLDAPRCPECETGWKDPIPKTTPKPTIQKP